MEQEFSRRLEEASEELARQSAQHAEAARRAAQAADAALQSAKDEWQRVTS